MDRKPDHLPPKDFPFTPEQMEEMIKRETVAKELRKAWLSRFLPGSVQSPDVTIPYLLYVPDGAPKYAPLVVMLHGIGGCGSDNMGQLLDNDALIDWIKAQDNGLLEPCYVLAPQCPTEIPNLRWEDVYLHLVSTAVDHIAVQYELDRQRLYLTGLSLGGYGVWNLNRLYPDKFAAVVSCCSACLRGTQLDERQMDDQGIEACAPALVDKPLWMFHAQDDFAVPVEVTQRMAQKLRELGKTDLMLTLYPAEQHYNHACWEPAYKTPEMFRWLAKQRLP